MHEKKNISVLGIETSCDETAVGIVRLIKDKNGGVRGEILSNVLASQEAIHQDFGGVVPELAARAHIETLPALLKKALAAAGIEELGKLDAIAATAGPGLIGGVMVGLVMGKAMAQVANLPFLPINHLEAHALSVKLTEECDYPFLLLLISGGHSALISVKGFQDYHPWGQTRDDAVGEAFDKTARLLSPKTGLTIAGGRFIENLAKTGEPKAFALPKPFFGAAHCDFSFAGLKTAVLRLTQKEGFYERAQNLNDMAASFQRTIADCLSERVETALHKHQKLVGHDKPLTIVAAGGVAANVAIRKKLTTLALANGGRFIAPPPQYCTDNGVMIAWAGAEALLAGAKSELNAAPKARWPLQ